MGTGCLGGRCECPFCGRGSLGDSRLAHSAQKNHHCAQCPKSFGTAKGLKWHMESHAPQRKLREIRHSHENKAKNTQLPKTKPRAPTAHRRSPKKPNVKKSPHKVHPCPYCSKTFRELSNLKVHERVHTADRPFSCTLCPKAFTLKGTLTEHMKIHTGEKPFGCSFCEKSYVHKINLEYHRRTHTGEKPYSCDSCDKTFTTSSDLNRHKRIHTGEKPYACSICNKGFCSSSNLKRHLKIHG